MIHQTLTVIKLLKPCGYSMHSKSVCFLISDFIGTDVSDDVEIITGNKGTSVLFHNAFKFIKSGESKTSVQYRCSNYMKKCRARILLVKETALSNTLEHNHPVDPKLRCSSMQSAILIRHLGIRKMIIRPKTIIHATSNVE